MNQLQVIGNLTRDADVKSSQQGDNYLQFAIAVNESKDKVMFVNVRQKQSTFPNGLLPYLLKGKKVFVQGRLTIGVYQSKQNGAWLPDITLWADKIELCGGGEQQEQHQQTPSSQPHGNVIYINKVGQDVQPQPTAQMLEEESTDVLPF